MDFIVLDHKWKAESTTYSYQILGMHLFERSFLTGHNDNPEEKLKFAVALEQGVTEKTICEENPAIKVEPLVKKNNECYNCSE